jgi:LmbE family N-acetylglucosaminyl deacetylase
MNTKRVLVLAPHTDDAELGCGGTIARFVEEQIDVTVVAFSTASDSLPPGAPPTLLRDEFHRAMALIGIKPENAIAKNYPVRRLSTYRQEVLEDLVRLRRVVNPQMVLLPSGSDLHQDHEVIFAEGLRAFKDLTVWGYELPWNHITYSAQAFVVLEKRHIESKWRSLQAYESQIHVSRPYFDQKFVDGLAHMRGVQVKAEYAESFEVLRIRW